MKLHQIFPALLLAGVLPLAGKAQAAPPPAGAIVSIAELDVDPAQIEAFKAAVIEEMDDSVRVEPGVHAIYAVANKNDPEKFTFFEIYASKQAQDEHRNTPHFRKFIDVTKDMVRGRRIVETNAVHLTSKP
ncbi:MAG: antibiotic biosynthesis monooxygenase [Cupriavidus sp.]|nr:antibiotic biosynthesis monooxygenase [Cupriavidus sp.]